jgi:Ran GTPase-activating protein (RanGAP) involved in mRNA processing and transport
MELKTILHQINVNSKIQLFLQGRVILAEDAATIALLLNSDPQIQHLSLIDVSIDDNDLLLIIESLRRSTSLKSFKFITRACSYTLVYAIAQLVKQNDSITSIVLSYPRLTASHFRLVTQALCENHTLKKFVYMNRLQLSGLYQCNAMDPRLLASVLGATASLNVLRCDYILFHPEHMPMLANSLQKNVSLRSLCLRGNGIENKGVLALSHALQSNTKLTSLDLSGNLLDHSSAAALAGALRNKSRLRVLKLNDTKIDSQSCEVILQGLLENTTLLTLELCSNYIQSLVVGTLTQVLAVNTSLTDIKLGGNCISAGIDKIAAVLQRNTTLKTLDLSSNYVGNFYPPRYHRGILQSNIVNQNALAHMLKVNTSLTSLDLSYNKIDDIGAQLLARAMLANHTLQHLMLAGNGITQLSFKSIMHLLRVNRSLQTFDLQNNTMGKAVDHSIASKLDSRSRYFALIASPVALQNTILYSLFSQPIPHAWQQVPASLKFHVTRLMSATTLFNQDAKNRALLAGWCFSTLGEQVTPSPCSLPNQLGH